MVLMSFSEEQHVLKLKMGEKDLTTRFLRKTPVKVGQTLQCYYRSREKKSCSNCIVDNCAGRGQVVDNVCSHHTNFFGSATVKAVLPIKEALVAIGKEEFSRRDGFDSWEEADKWFGRNSSAGHNWTTLPYVVIQFEPHWIRGGGQ